MRFTAQGEREARNLGEIRKQLNEQGYTTPLVADIHFNPRAADAAAGVKRGNIVAEERLGKGHFAGAAALRREGVDIAVFGEQRAVEGDAAALEELA